jgi:hypothetical protein
MVVLPCLASSPEWPVGQLRAAGLIQLSDVEDGCFIDIRYRLRQFLAPSGRIRRVIATSALEGKTDVDNICCHVSF